MFLESYLRYIRTQHDETPLFGEKKKRGKKHQSLPIFLKSYLRYIRTQHDKTLLYIFDANFADINSEMAEAYEVQKYFKEVFFSFLPEKRPPYRWIIIGP